MDEINGRVCVHPSSENGESVGNERKRTIINDSRGSQPTRTAVQYGKTPMAINKTRMSLAAVLLAMLPATSIRAATVYRFPGDGLSWSYRLKVAGDDVPVTATPDIDAAACHRIAAANSKMAKWLAPAAKFVGVHYAHLACSGEPRVELIAAEPIQRFTIHPKRRGVKAVVEGRSLRFTVDRQEPRYFVIEVNDLPPVCLIVDPPEKDIPEPTGENVVDASKYLADDAGATDQTEGFARAIAAVNGTNKTLYVRAGIYQTGAITIHDAADFSIYLAPGCLIRTKTSPRGENIHSLGISIDRSKNIRIFGRGCLDQQAYENFVVAGNDYRHRTAADKDPKAVFGDYQAVPALSQAGVLVMRSQNIELDGLTVRNSRNFHYNIVGCDRVTLRRCKALTPPACVPEWTDGLDVAATDSLAIDGFFAYCNDDCFAWGNVPDYGRFIELAQSRELSNCTIRGMVGWNSRANAIRLGWRGDASVVGIRDILFENCDFCGMEASGVLLGRLKEDAAAVHPPRYGTLRFVDCGFDCERIHGRPFAGRKARIDRLEFQNVVVDSAEKAWVIEGVAPGAVGRLVFRNVSVAGEKVADLKKAGIHIKNAEKVIVE